jgi:hypothetical protein
MYEVSDSPLLAKCSEYENIWESCACEERILDSHTQCVALERYLIRAATSRTNFAHQLRVEYHFEAFADFVTHS